jgi:hypothetical protein
VLIKHNAATKPPQEAAALALLEHMLCSAPALPLLQHLRVGINQGDHKKQLAAASSADRELVACQGIELTGRMQVTVLQLKRATFPISLCYLAKCM